MKRKEILKVIGQATVCLIFLCIVPTSLSNAQDDTQPLAEMLDDSVFKTPVMHRESSKDQGNVQAIFYDALPYKGKPTRVFAYLGVPKSDKPVPAMVLVHGGGGNAFHEWVKIWNDRGYAAIAMSLEGHMTKTESGKGKQKHAHSGPSRQGMFSDFNEPFEDQWMYHAVSDIVLAHSLLASQKEVDADRIGVTGISWGGILSSLVSGVDTRFKCAMPVYGCGYLYDSKGNFKNLNRSPTAVLEKKKFWDPARHFASGSMPTLWVNGDSDGHFSVDTTSRSFETTRDHAFLTIHPKMRHGHAPGWKPESVPEIYAFADHFLKGESPGLGRITQQPSGRKVELKFESESPINEATVYYLNEKLTYRKLDEKDKHLRPGPWLTIPAKLDQSKSTVQAQLPDSCLTYYVNLKDARGLIISSKLVELKK